VLVVDDNRDAADSLSMLVETWGHAVRRAYGGAAALEIASAYRPHALLLDVAMPKLDGCQLARLLRGQACFTQALLIAITGYADETHHLLCMEAGFDQWLVKPVEPSIVERLLQLEKDRLAESGKRLAHARAGNQPGRHTPDLEQNQAEDRWRDDGGQG
jgi:two-component system OmpR family response regulator